MLIYYATTIRSDIQVVCGSSRIVTT